MTDQQKLIDENNIILKLCTNMFTTYMNLFCNHKIQQCRTEDECLRLNDFNPYWQFKTSTYSQIIPFLHINDLIIDFFLQMVKSSVAQSCRHLIDSVNKSSHCEHKHNRSTHQNPSEFKKINVEKAHLQIIAMQQAAVEQY